MIRISLQLFIDFRSEKIPSSLAGKFFEKWLVLNFPYESKGNFDLLLIFGGKVVGVSAEITRRALNQEKRQWVFSDVVRIKIGILTVMADRIHHFSFPLGLTNRTDKKFFDHAGRQAATPFPG